MQGDFHERHEAHMRRTPLPRLEGDSPKPVVGYIFTCGVCFGVVVMAALFMAFHQC